MRPLQSALCSALVCIALLLAACGGEDPEAGLSVLHRPLSTDPESLDPQRARTTQAADVLRDVGEGLVRYDAKGALVPGTAESWEVSEDGLVYTFTIRPQARWSDGQPVTASHFADGLRRLVDPATAAFYAQAVLDIENARAVSGGELPVAELGVEAVDAGTLVIRLERPVPYLLSLLTHPSVFPARLDIPKDEDQAGDAWTVFNGAYTIDRWQPGSMVRLLRNPEYWDDADTAIDVVYHHLVTEEQSELNRYRSGELHFTNNVPPESFDAARKEYGDQLRVSEYLGVYYYGFNLTRPPFADNLALRQALSMAIDRDVLAETIMGRGEIPAYSWVPSGTNNYEPPRLSYAELSSEERNAIAKRLFAEAGYGPDNTLAIELRYNTSATQRRVALAVQAMWRDVLGVEATLIAEEFQVLLDSIRDRRDTQVFRSSWIGDYNDANTFLELMLTDNPANLPGYSNAEFDALMARAAEQQDLDRRRLYLEEAERIMLADHPTLPLYFYVSERLVSPEVRGWEDNVLDYHYSQHLGLSAAE